MVDYDVVSEGEPTTSLTDELRAQLTSVSTATLTFQLQKRGIRSTFLSGLRPVREGQRMVGLAHTLRYVPMREDLQPTLGAGQKTLRPTDPARRTSAYHAAFTDGTP